MKNFFLFLLVSSLVLVPDKLAAADYALSTNFADYARLGTMNLELSRSLSRHWSVNAGVKYNPFTFGEGEDSRQNRERSIIAGTRFWPWYVYSGWWLSGKLRYQEYNAGGFDSPLTQEGDRFGGGMALGYSKMLGTHFNLDLGFGMWMGYDRYVVYACPRCGRVMSTGGKYFLMPNDVILSLSYIF